MFQMAKRLFLFMAVNILVVLTISITLNLLGVRPYLSARGIDYGALLTFCLIWGMAGSFISLGLSRMMAKWSMGVQLVDDRHELARMVHRLAEQAGLPEKPEVGIYQSPEPNAFATGPTKSRSLVAVSTGLLESMSSDELEGVLGHEVAHIANGDMVTMTLVQGVINAFVMFFARILGYFIAAQLSRSDDRESRGSFGMQYLITMVLEIAFSFLGMLVVAWFSRHREFRADNGGARLAGREKMVRALMALKRSFQPADPVNAVSAFKIAGGGGLMALLSTHPPLDARIARLNETAL
jgi:heat shock protein HtpX